MIALWHKCASCLKISSIVNILQQAVDFGIVLSFHLNWSVRPDILYFVLWAHRHYFFKMQNKKKFRFFLFFLFPAIFHMFN